MISCYTYYYKFKKGYLIISYTDSSITGLLRAKDLSHIISDNYSNDLLNRTIKQLDEYFEGIRFEFDLPLSFKGTDFQMKVWRELLNIPYGETRSYKDIATAIGKPKACRAVGGANNKNPIILICPCHRVIGASGKLVGYGGGLDMKEYLLSLESSNLK
jgi:O-6-methylguanine DNA methyltransferase